MKTKRIEKRQKLACFFERTNNDTIFFFGGSVQFNNCRDLIKAERIDFPLCIMCVIRKGYYGRSI